jgi:RNA polymerase-binding transcription factor
VPAPGWQKRDMEKAQITKFETILKTKREELRKSQAQEEKQEEYDFGRDEGDRANFSQSKEMAFRQKAQDRGLLMMVESAISRIEDGSFGICINCGQEITLARLNAVPWSRYCITCQEMIMERK